MEVIMTDWLIVLGALIAIIGGILFIIETFKVSWLWCLGCILLSPISIVFIFLHWDVSKKPVLLQLSGFAIVGVGLFLTGNF
jgi:hypothetical protein